jgi:hypothetical protein
MRCSRVAHPHTHVKQVLHSHREAGQRALAGACQLELGDKGLGRVSTWAAGHWRHTGVWRQAVQTERRARAINC